MCSLRPARRCREKIVQGRVDKIAKEMSLMDQAFIKDTSLTVAVSWRAELAGHRAWLAAGRHTQLRQDQAGLP